MPHTWHIKRAYISFSLACITKMWKVIWERSCRFCFILGSLLFSLFLLFPFRYMWANNIVEQHNSNFFSPRFLSFMHCWKNMKLDFPWREACFVEKSIIVMKVSNTWSFRIIMLAYTHQHHDTRRWLLPKLQAGGTPGRSVVVNFQVSKFW